MPEVPIKARLQLLAIAACVAAVWLAWHLAHENYMMPLLVGSVALLGATVWLLRAPVAAVLLGVVLFGYLVGNRGFAQVMPAPWLPLLPAELTLLIAGSWWLVQCAFAHRLPFRRDALNWVLLAWLVIGTARAIFDVRQFGLMAIRDFAMVYYALFFFLAQNLASDSRCRRILIGSLAVAAIVQPLVAVLAEAFPEFFYGFITFRGIPLIAFKGDLALTFTAVSALVIAFVLPARHRWWAWPIAMLELVYVLGSANRASMLGAAIALGWLALSPLRRFVAAQFAVVTLAVMLLAGGALLTENVWAERKFGSVTERIESLTDVFGQGTYESEESFMKGDNNRFRSIWWQTVVNETMAHNALFGLGFGYDLARGFLQNYNPDMAEEFTARSPHSIVVSAFGRMGLVGLTVFLGICVLIARRTWQIVRAPAAEPEMLGLGGAIWVILVSALFGVVLEGPMAAVVFWTLLGLVNAPADEQRSAPTELAAADPTLRESQSQPEVTATS